MATVSGFLSRMRRPRVSSKDSPRDSVISLPALTVSTSTRSRRTETSIRPSLDRIDHLATPLLPQSSLTNPNVTNCSFYEDSLTGDHVRLIRIAPGAHHEPISCTLIPAKLTDGHFPGYTALSYCWGPDTQPSTSITVNDRPGFKISKHLRDGLVRLRRPDVPRHVWVDAICINQDNTTERGHQVDRMRQIFNRASAVVIWLGELKRSAALPTCKRHVPGGDGHHSQAVCSEPGLSSLEHGNVDQDIQNKLLGDEERSWEEAYLGQVWWKRLWVIQEFCVAERLPTVCIGQHTISWDYFYALLSEKLWPDSDDHTWQRLRHSPRRQTLYELLQSTSNGFYCSEPRDRIYALLGLIDTDGDQTKLEVNYEKPVVTVFEEAVLYIIQQEGSIDCLLDYRNNRLLDNMKDESGQLPTWIPRFAFIQDAHAVKTPDKFSAGYHAPRVSLVPCKSSNATCACVTNHALQIRGILFDEIAKKVDMHKVPSFGMSTRHNVLKQLGIDYSKPPKFNITRAPNIGYLMLDFLFTGTEVSIVDTFKRVRQEIVSIKGLVYIPAYAYCEQLTQEFGFPKTDPTILDLTVAATFEDLFKKKVNAKSAKRQIKTKWGIYTAPPQRQERVFFSTASGYSGIGPVSLEKGDVIVVPFGSSRPLILRSHGDHYILVGDAVIHGIMSGQLMDLHQHDDAHVADFCLK